MPDDRRLTNKEEQERRRRLEREREKMIRKLLKPLDAPLTEQDLEALDILYPPRKRDSA